MTSPTNAAASAIPIPKSTLGPKSTLAPAPTPPTIDPKIKKAAGEFESMVLSQMLAPIFESLDSDGLFGGGSAERMFRPMLVDQYAKGMAKAGGLGLADAVAREMMRLQGATSTDPEVK